MEVQETKPVYEVVGDEGRYRRICETYSTAKRFAQAVGSRHIQGTQAIKVSGTWYAETHIEPASKSDREREERREAYEKVVSRMIDAGIPESDIEIVIKGW
ncbi:MAG: hypothetical protein AAGB04_19510 [Pseudomonadota bacterium]